MKKVCYCLLFCFFCVSCGQTGPLVLPTEKEDDQQSQPQKTNQQ